LINLKKALRMASPEDRKWCEARLEGLMQSAPPDWLKSGSVQAALGGALGELGRLSEAITRLEAAKSAQPGDVQLEALEQLVNLRARAAEMQYAQRPAESEKEFGQIENEFKLLLKLAETPERLCIGGSLHKRWAMALSDDEESLKHLKEAASLYRRAYELAIDPKSSYVKAEPAYALQNALATEVILSWSSRARVRANKQFESSLAALDKLAKTLPSEKPDTWTFFLPPEAALLLGMFKQRIRDIDGLLALYRDARRRSGSPREVDSVLKQISFYRKVIGRFAPMGRQAALLRDLDALEAGLRDM
jgi:hypothetical protein